jgi:hypothetical protein
MIPTRPIFVVSLRPEPGVDPLRALRAALKSLLRQYGLKAIAVRERDRRQEEAEAQLREQQAARDDRRIDDIAAQLEEAEQELLEP